MMRFTSMLTLLMIWGCATELNITLPYEGKQLVLYCILSPDKVASAQIDRTYPPTGDVLYEPPIKTAVIEILENDKVVETLKYTSGNAYESPRRFRPVAGRSYKIRASASGFPTVESDAETIPLSPQIVGSSVEKTNNNRISVEIKDYPNQTNQYSIQIAGTYEGKQVAINVLNLSRPDAISDNCGFRGNLNSFYYRDVCFDGTTLKTSYNSNLFGTVQVPDLNGRYISKNPDQIQIIVRNVSATYFNYYKFYPPEDIELAFKQPSSRLYNLKGGYGLFAVYNEKVVVYLN